MAKKINFKTLWKEIQKKIDGIDLIFLNKQPETINNFNNPFVKFLNSQHYSDVFIIKLFKDFNNYLNSFANKKFLKEFLRLNKKLYADHRVEIKLEDKKNKIISPRDIIIKKIEQINSLKIKTDLSSELGVFYNNLYEKEKFSSIFTLSIDQEIVAASYNFIYKDRFYYFIPVIFSNKYKKFSLGKILLYNLIKWSYEKKLFFFDFGLGNEDYKKYWSNFRQKLYRYIEFKTFKGFILSLLLRLYFFFKSFKKL